jgi:glycosyltransferase involved in cell wall biosynthesis
MSQADCSQEVPFDGIICIGGEDWWYHNRGHFDFQIMRRLARRVPVLFVNSLAVRVPSLKDKRQFAAKVGRKLRSLSRGLVEAEPNFWVMSPLAFPGGMGRRLSSLALAPQIMRAARRAGIKRPLLWIHCPAGEGLINALPHHGLVLQRTDRFEAFPEGDAVRLAAQIDRLKSRADLAIYCNSSLMAEEADAVARQLLVSHGVDLEMFEGAGKGRSSQPEDVAALPQPRVGFIGGIDAHTFGTDLFLDAVRRLPDVTFVMIGACSLPDGWCPFSNVHFLGRKPYDAVASYMAAMDVLVMPWNDSAWIKASNPIKLKEYLAVGRPIVTADFPALAPYRDLVAVANSGHAFADAIRTALAEPFDACAGRARIQGEGWDAKADQIWWALRGVSVAASLFPKVSRLQPAA